MVEQPGKKLFIMAANSKKNIVGGTQRGEGQVSHDTVVPISASSFTHAAEAATNVETDIPLSMTGATGASAPNGSADSQVPGTGENSQRKKGRKMKPMKKDGGEPPAVEPNPTSGKLTLVAHLKSRGETHGYSEGIADEVQVALVKMAMNRNALSIEQVPSDVDENQFLMPIQVTDQVTIGDKVFDGFYDKRLMRFLDVAKPIKLKKCKVSNVLKLLSEQTGYNTDAVENLEHGDLGAPIMAIQGGHYSKRMSTYGWAPIVMYFYSISLDPMSVSDFGNFLYAIKHHGDEVALATLRHIYENAR